MRLLLFGVLLVVSLAAHAYREAVQIRNVPTGETCDSLLINSSDPFHLTPEAISPPTCQWQSVVFELYLFNYPTHVAFELSAIPAPAEEPTFKTSVLATWGNMLTSGQMVMYQCDANGDALFAYASLHEYTPQKLFVEEHTPALVRGEFDIVVLPTPASDAAPKVGDGLAFAVAMCPLKHVKRNTTAKFDLELQAQVGFWWGLLHPTMWAEMILLIVVSIPKLMLVVWFIYRCRMFNDHVMSQQKWFLLTSIFSLVSAVALLVFLLVANQTGVDTICCPQPVAASVLVGFKYASNMFFDLLLLATCKGWGVVANRLERNDRVSITAYFFVSMLVYVMSQAVGVSLEIAWLMVMLESGLWCWIFVSLNHTIRELNSSGRLDRNSKLEMYNSLLRILKRALLLWVLLGVLVTGIVVFAYVKYNRLDSALLVPSTLAWDVTLVYLMISFGYVWRPSPATAAFSYSFARREDEDGIDLRDPVERFGVEET